MKTNETINALGSVMEQVKEAESKLKEKRTQSLKAEQLLAYKEALMEVEGIKKAVGEQLAKCYEFKQQEK